MYNPCITFTEIPVSTPASPADDTELFPIRTVSSLTGVNAITLRAWERRYGLVKPVRTPGGQRAYTRANIDAIHRILAQLDKGVSIGQVREPSPERPARASRRQRPADPWQAYRTRMIAAIAQFDEDRLEDEYNDVLSLYPSELVTARVLQPLLAELGERWLDAVGSIAEEHFFGVYLRNKLGARFHHRARRDSGPRLLSACLPGEFHEIGLLLFALAAHERGFRPVLLGADMPLAGLAAAAQRSRAAAIVLSGAIEPRPALLADELPALVASAGVPVFIGGPRSVRDGEEVIAAGAQPLGEDIPHALKRLGDALGHPRAG